MSWKACYIIIIIVVVIIINIISCNMQYFIIFLFFIAGFTGKASKAPGSKGGLRTTGGAARLEVKKIAVDVAAAVVGDIIVRSLPTAKPWTLTLMMISLQISSKVSYFLPFCPAMTMFKPQCIKGMPV